MFKVLVICSVLALALAAPAPSEAETNAKNAALQAALNAKAPKQVSTAQQAPGPNADAQAAGPSADAQAAGPSERETNNENAKRQHGVNKQALYYGAGVGTAPYYGVPGTDKKGYHNAHYAAPAYGAYGYGHHGAYNGAHRGAYHGAHHGAHYDAVPYGAYNGAHRGAYHYGNAGYEQH